MNKKLPPNAGLYVACPDGQVFFEGQEIGYWFPEESVNDPRLPAHVSDFREAVAFFVLLHCTENNDYARKRLTVFSWLLPAYPENPLEDWKFTKLLVEALIDQWETV